MFGRRRKMSDFSAEIEAHLHEHLWVRCSRFPVWHQAGMTLLDVLRAITTNAAEMLGWQDRIGTIEAGKFADLAAVTGDPVTDITELERVRFVIKNGEVVKNDFAAH